MFHIISMNFELYKVAKRYIKIISISQTWLQYTRSHLDYYIFLNKNRCFSMWCFIKPITITFNVHRIQRKFRKLET